MANVQDMKAQKAEKTLRLFTILLLVVGVASLAVAVYDLVSGSSLLKLGAQEVADTNFGGLTVAYIMLIVAGILLVVGAVMHLVKGNYRVFQGTCIAAIIFSLYPMICFAVNIGSFIFALVYALLALAIIVLAIIALKARWQVYIKEMTGEVKKLTWLNMKELVKATAVVLVFVLAFALLIFVLDYLFNWPVQLLLKPSTTSATTSEPASDDGITVIDSEDATGNE